MIRFTFISIFFLSIFNTYAQSTLTIHQIKAKGDTLPELLIANYEDTTYVKTNDSTIVFKWDSTIPEYLFIIVNRKTKWRTRLWMNPEIKQRELTIDYTTKSVVVKDPTEWDILLDKMHLLEQERKDKEHDSIAIFFLEENPETYLSLWFLTHGVSYNDRNQKLSLFQKLDKSLQIYPEYIQLNADLTARKYPNIGDTFKEFELKDKNNISFNSERIKNKWILINFWSNGCAPCIKEMDAFVELYKSVDTTKIEFICVALDESNSVWKKGNATNKIIWPSVWQPSGSYGDLCLNYNVTAMPTFILFDNEKKIFYIKDGANELENIKVTFKEKALLK